MKALLLSFLLLVPATAGAQQQSCGPVNNVLKWLSDSYGENVDYTMSSDDGTQHIFITVNPETGTGTVLGINGPVACILAAGKHFTVHKGI